MPSMIRHIRRQSECHKSYISCMIHGERKKIIKVAFLSKIHKFNLIMKKLNKQTNEQKTLRHHLVATAGVVIFEVVWFVFSPLRGTEPSRALSLQEKAVH